MLFTVEKFQGKLLRNEITKDSVEIEAVSDPHRVRDRVKNDNETQLARILHLNGILYYITC